MQYARKCLNTMQLRSAMLRSFQNIKTLTSKQKKKFN